MPIIKQAAKKLRRDQRRTQENTDKERALLHTIKTMRKHPTAKNLEKAMSGIDKATKIHRMHKNKAARLKSSLAKLLSKKK